VFFSFVATSDIYTLSLHDALPICLLKNFSNGTIDSSIVSLSFSWELNTQIIELCTRFISRNCTVLQLFVNRLNLCSSFIVEAVRSEEHTSELQSRENLVCRLLLEK